MTQGAFRSDEHLTGTPLSLNPLLGDNLLTKGHGKQRPYLLVG